MNTHPKNTTHIIRTADTASALAQFGLGHLALYLGGHTASTLQALFCLTL